mmetsp:Transcript_98224/g.254019  ORF Transcript_98224/g.254019 Transcript_98224/m.254019 type:complete len:1094 (-) Transcript_98224:37-3318(-)
MEKSQSTPIISAGAPEEVKPGKPGKKYNINQYKGLLTSISDVKKTVDAERKEAKDKVLAMEEKMKAKDAEAAAIQKELSVQLRCAGRSYQQLLDATRELTEQLRIEEAKRNEAIEPLEKEIKKLKSELSQAAKPWKDEVAKRDLKILKLQEAAANQETRLREALAAVGPVRQQAEAEVKAREEKIEVVLNAMELIKAEFKEKEQEAEDNFEAFKVKAAKEKCELEVRYRDEKAKIDGIHAPYRKTIKELELKIQGLENQLDEVDYTPYERQLRQKDAGYDKLVKDFKIKQQMNTENIDRMRAGFEATLAKMDAQLQDVEKEFERRLVPWQELVEKKEGEIVKLNNKIQLLIEEEAQARKQEEEEKAVLNKELKAAKGGVESLQRELYALKREREDLENEMNEKAPARRMQLMEMKLEEVTEKCQIMIKRKDGELKEKMAIILKLQQRIVEDANAAEEIDKEWDRRIQEKEEGYGKVCAQLKFAEGQIMQERERVAQRDATIRKLETNIVLLKGEHDEELRHRLADREELEREIRRLEELLEEEADAHRDLMPAMEKRFEDFRERSEVRIKDLRIEIDRRETQKAQISEELTAVKSQFQHARLQWEEKEREYEIMIRGRDRLITNLKNEIEFMNDSWEIKYNRLAGLYEKVQKKLDEQIGSGGVAEAFRRIRDLKIVNQTLQQEILELKEMIKKQKRNIRDLQLDLDMLRKETADIIAEKEKGIAEMVGDMAKLESRYRAEVELKEALVREMTAEKIAIVESYAARIEQLEQLVESMRYTDRQDLVDTIDVWKRAYERICIERDELEDHYKELIDTKDLQLKKMAEDNAEVRRNVQEVKEAAAEELEKEIEKWKKQQTKWVLAKQEVEQEVERLKLEIIQLKREVDKMAGLAGSASLKDEAEKEALRKEIKDLEEKLAIVEAGKGNLVKEIMELEEKCSKLSVQTESAAEDWEPQIRWRDERYEAMVKEHEMVKEILALEMQKAQDTCKYIEEQVRRFPNPFEQELVELKEKYAQQEAGVMKLSLDNMRLQEEHKDYVDLKEKEMESLEDALKMASAILKEVASLGALKSMSKDDMDDLEKALGIDLDGDGVVG